MSVILITGASSGIGKATAQLLLSRKHTVYVAARRIEAMNELQKLGAIALKMDITQDADIQAVVKRVLADQGHIDVLINNAGFGMYGAVEDTSIEDARYQFEVNLFGLARLTQLVLPAMRSEGKGRIINTSSMGGKIYTPLGAWYHATKHAVEGWSDCLRLEVAPFGIDVVIIEPGIIATEFGDVLTEPMLKRSGNGAYGPLAKKIAGASGTSMSPPSVIAEAMLSAVEAKKPKTRYVAGKFAKMLILIRKYFGDRVYDKLIMSQIK